MPWIYVQATGTLKDPEGKVAAIDGYSGFSVGKNNTSMEREQNIGPIPRGAYRIGSAHYSYRTGPVSMNLTPTAGTNTFGRDAFLIHGDNLSHTASHGCIILRRDIRERISHSTDKDLMVR